MTLLLLCFLTRGLITRIRNLRPNDREEISDHLSAVLTTNQLPR